MKLFQHKKQQGFSILGVILFIVILIVAISVWALSGQTNTNNSGNTTADIQAASIGNDASSIKLAFDTLVINGATPSTIIFTPNVATTASTPNILDQTTGLQIPRPNVNSVRTAVAEPEGIWVYSKTLTGNNIGTSAADFAIVLAGVKNTVCERINFNLYGVATIPPVTTPTTGAGFVTGATVGAPTTTAAITLPAGANGWSSGCISANGVADNNMYFRILKAN
jgi:type II secretory pathway pseudopilin PulG